MVSAPEPAPRRGRIPRSENAAPPLWIGLSAALVGVGLVLIAIAWPEAYWPAHDDTATPEQLARTIEGFRSDRAALRAIVADPATDLLAPIAGTPGHTILREVRLVGDHNAYHIGEFAILRQVMGTWPANRDE